MLIVLLESKIGQWWNNIDQHLSDSCRAPPFGDLRTEAA